jgi:hypothetical protein
MAPIAVVRALMAVIPSEREGSHHGDSCHKRSTRAHRRHPAREWRVSSTIVQNTNARAESPRYKPNICDHLCESVAKTTARAESPRYETQHRCPSV